MNQLQHTQTTADTDIAGFFMAGWYVFDNFAPFQVEWRGKLWPTSEHAYQAAHFINTDPELAETVRTQRSPRLAADVANAHSDQDDPDWPKIKLTVMQDICRHKLEQHQLVQDTLRESGDRRIVELNHTDAFWGCGPDGNGRNELGKVWMKLREELLGK
jgi:ribA/ribD-fused uncharacterized protein